MTNAKLYGYNLTEGMAGVQATRDNAVYCKGGTFKTPLRMYYLKTVYDTDANGNQLYDTEGKKKIKSQKWEPCMRGVPTEKTVLTGIAIGNSKAYYGPLNSGSTVNLNPLYYLASKGYDTEDVWNMPGTVKLAFRRSADTSSTIRDVGFGFALVYHDGSTVATCGTVNQNQEFSFTIKKSALDAMRIVWFSATKSTNTGWQVPIDWSYSMTFIP